MCGVAAACLAALALLAGPARADAALMERLESIKNAAITAYNARDWNAAAASAGEFEQALESAGLPAAGADYALVAFIGGHARFEIWKQAPESFRYDFDRDVVGAMERSLQILQDDPFYKHNVLGTAYYEKLKREHFQNLELENRANWHMLRALMARHEQIEDQPRDSEEYTAFAKYLLLYANRAFEMARHSEVPELYLVRVREACRMGFGSRFADRFAQLYEVVGFDDGNTRAGVLWQIGLDMMNAGEAPPREVLDTFTEAAAVTRGQRERAEVFRQMSDFASRQDAHEFKLEAVEYARKAFRLDPDNTEIRVQYGTSLHVLSYAHFLSGRFREALDIAEEAVSFEWEGDEVAYFDLSRAQANFGDKINALVNAERAYQKARARFSDDELQPFRQNYVNILRQFGLPKKAEEIELAGSREQGS